MIRPNGLPVPLKHDVPPYMQMLFSARGRLPYVRPLEKNKCRSYDSISSSVVNLMEKLENTTENTESNFVSKKVLKLRQWNDKLEEHKETLKDLYEKCKIS